MVFTRNAFQCRGVDDGEIQLFFRGAQCIKQIEDLIDDPVGARAGAVNLVDHHDRLKTLGKGFGSHEACLRHGAVDGIHKQQHRVDHGEHALNLTTEVGVPRRIHNVDAVVAVVNGGVLGENRDAPLFFLIVGIHDPLCINSAAIKGARLAQQAVNEGRLAMVDVGDDGDVAEFFDHSKYLLPHRRSQAGKAF